MVTMCENLSFFQKYFRFLNFGHKKVCPIFKTPRTFYRNFITEKYYDKTL